ncbi:MAG: recombinase family protein, partial [bacterium]
MATVGYARVSSTGQSLEVQNEQLRAAGCEKVFSEKVTGTTTEGREQLEAALDYVREGDVLIVTRLDRLARSLVDLRK